MRGRDRVAGADIAAVRDLGRWVMGRPVDADVRPAGFGNQLGWGSRPALLLIDMVRAYFESAAPFYLGRPDVVDKCVSLLQAARHNKIPIVHTTIHYSRDAADAGLFIRKIPALRLFCAGAAHDWHETVAELTPQDGETVVVKQYASAFSGTSLAATLCANSVDTVVIAGVSTSGCVRATATDALQHGFRPMVVEQACADRSDAIHEANLYDLGQKYADIVDLGDTITVFNGTKMD